MQQFMITAVQLAIPLMNYYLLIIGKIKHEKNLKKNIPKNKVRWELLTMDAQHNIDQN